MICELYLNKATQKCIYYCTFRPASRNEVPFMEERTLSKEKNRSVQADRDCFHTTRERAQESHRKAMALRNL